MSTVTPAMLAGAVRRVAHRITFDDWKRGAFGTLEADEVLPPHLRTGPRCEAVIGNWARIGHYFTKLTGIPSGWMQWEVDPFLFTPEGDPEGLRRSVERIDLFATLPGNPGGFEFWVRVLARRDGGAFLEIVHPESATDVDDPASLADLLEGYLDV